MPLADPGDLTQIARGLTATADAVPAPRTEKKTRRRKKSSSLRRVSIVIPALDEEEAMPALLERLGRVCEELRPSGYRFETIVIDDGSSDGTARVASRAGARVHSHPRPLGNGAAIKRGIRLSRGDLVLFLDGDGQHPPEKIPDLLAAAETHDLVVGARGGSGHGIHRQLANRVYNTLASWVVGKPIPDLTSGFRCARADVLKNFCYLLPNTFSYPTTMTLAFFRGGYSVAYVPIEAAVRSGRSKIHVAKDGVRFLLIIAKICTFFAPLRIFGPMACFIVGLGIANYAHTYLTQGRFTNMSLLLLILGAITLGLGLISEQIAALRFDRSEG